MNIRLEWLEYLLKIVRPVLDHLSAGTLKQRMPLDYHPDRAVFAPLEAFGRSMLGLAPWLEADAECLDPEERMLQQEWLEKALICLDQATNPDSPDYMVFDRGGQPLVDTAFLAHAIVRAPKSLGNALNERKAVVMR